MGLPLLAVFFVFRSIRASGPPRFRVVAFWGSMVAISAVLDAALWISMAAIAAPQWIPVPGWADYLWAGFSLIALAMAAVLIQGMTMRVELLSPRFIWQHARIQGII